MNRAKAMGLDVESAIEKQDLAIRHFAPVEVDLDRFGDTLRKELELRPLERVVIDSLAELTYAVRETERLPGFVFTMLRMIAAAGSSALVTSETELFGPSSGVGNGLMVLFQNVVSLRYVEVDSEIRRAVGVLNMRSSAHERELYEYVIDEAGLKPVGPLKDVSGAMGWSMLKAGTSI